MLPLTHLPVTHLRGEPAVPEVLYPHTGQQEVSWDAGRGTLTVALPGTPAALLIRLRAGTVGSDD